jgi:hypothetical protein
MSGVKITKETAKDYALRLRGQPKKKTIVKKSLEKIMSVEEFREDVLNLWDRLLKSRSERVRLVVAKELTPFLFPKKKDLSLNMGKRITFTVVDKTKELK